MRPTVVAVAVCCLAAGAALSYAQTPAGSRPAVQNEAAAANDPIKALITRLDVEKHKATVKGLTQCGDGWQGHDRNRDTVAWHAAQLKGYGCPTECLKYEHKTPEPEGRGGAAGRGAGGRGRGPDEAQGGGRLRGIRARTGVNTDPMKQPDEKLRALNMQPATDGPREE